MDQNFVDATGDPADSYNKTSTKNIAWLDDWEKYMTDFKADSLLTFPIASKTEEVFIESIKKPCNIRGAYFSSYDSKEPLNFYVGTTFTLISE